MPGPRNRGNVPYNPYDPVQWNNMSDSAKMQYWGQLNPQQQAQLTASINMYNSQKPQEGYNDQFGQAFNDALSGFYGSMFSGGSSGGRGGRGGGGGGGSAPPDYGLDYGLSRDQINAQRGQLQNQHGLDLKNRDLASQLQAMQVQQANFQHPLDVRNLLGGSAARGATTTAGTGIDMNTLNTQFSDLMKRLGIQGQQMNLSNQSQDQQYLYGLQGNDFSQQGLDIQAGKTGYKSPFTIPNPVPVARK